MLDKEQIGKTITRRRKQLGMTQKQLAELLHISYQAVSRWELGSSVPTMEMMVELAGVLQTSVDYLIKGEVQNIKGIDYMDSGLNTTRLYSIKDELQELVEPDECIAYAHYKGPTFFRVPGESKKDLLHVSQQYVPGSKLRMAKDYGYDREICEDLVASAINDLVQYGVKPLTLRSGIICGNLARDQFLQMGRVFKDSCQAHRVSFAGMDIACQPINFLDNDYQLTATITGVAAQEELLVHKKIKEGDVVIGIATEGINGISYPFVRVMLDRKPKLVNARVDGRQYFIEALMRPTAIYNLDIQELMEAGILKGVIRLRNRLLPGWDFVTILPKELCAYIDLSRIPIPPLYQFIAKQGMIDKTLMPDRFHMGIGMLVIVDGACQRQAMECIGKYHTCYPMGYIGRKEQEENRTFCVTGDLKW